MPLQAPLLQNSRSHELNIANDSNQEPSNESSRFVISTKLWVRCLTEKYKNKSVMGIQINVYLGPFYLFYNREGKGSCLT
jgi:hypothetical protein